MSTSDPQPLASSSRPARRGGAFLLFATVAVLAAAIAWWQRPDHAAIQRELDAKNELATLGALVVMDAGRTHVNSVNLATLKSPDSLGRAIELLPSLGYLQSLNADGTALGDEQAQAVGRLSSLQDLVLNHTAITDDGLQKLTGLSRLKTLHLANTAITNAGMPPLARLRSLNILDISGTKVTGNFEPLAGLPDLTWLVARRLALDGAAVESLVACESLERLSINETTYPPEAIDKLVKMRTALSIDR